MTTLFEAIQPYLDPKTKCVLASDGGGDNQQLFTAILLALMPGPENLANKMEVIFNFYSFIRTSTIEGFDGLVARYPGATDNSVDNYIAISSASPLFVSKYGSKHYWSFNVSNPGHFSLHDCYLRFMGFRPYVLMLAGESVLILSQLLYIVSMFFTLSTGKTDVGNIQLQWLMNRKVKGKHKLIDLAIRLWAYIALKRWPGGMSQIFAIYHGANHPFATFGPKDFS